MEKKQLHIVHLGVSGFPYGFGAAQRIQLLYKGLQYAGARVTVINRKGVYPADGKYDLRPEGEFEGIYYRYTSPSPFRPEGFLRRNWEKLAGAWGELRYLLRLRREGQLDGALLYNTGQFGQLLYFWLLSRLLRFPLMLSYVEYRSAFQGRQKLGIRINDYLFDHYAARFCDAILPISEFLVKAVRRQSARTPMLKVPVICDFEKFAVERDPATAPHFLYVGAASYRELIEFTMRAFDSIPDKRGMELQIVMGGSEAELKAVEAIHAQMASRALIRLLPNRPHSEIPGRLANATALLIPMRPNVQDEARFPHKVGEYVASGSPMVTNAFGEICYYFRDRETAFVAPEFREDAFAAKMQEVVENPALAAEVGRQAREMGLTAFNYKTHGLAMLRLFRRLRGEPAPSAPQPETLIHS